MRQIRRGVFETNSSSTHSMTIVSKEDYDRWGKGELFYDPYRDILVDRKHVDKRLKDLGCTINSEEDFYESLEDFDFYTQDTYYDKYISDFEAYEKSFITKSGDEIVVFGYFRYDG